jgi:hypothetical protein
MKKFIFLALLLSACQSGKDVPMPMSRDETRKESFGKLFGPEALAFGAPKKGWSNQATAGMRVNPFLWSASIETLSFMPFASSDAVGGVLVTDWYSSASAPNERMKVTVHIKDTVLRPDALSINIHKEIKASQGTWVAAQVTPEMTRQLEDIILTKARELTIKNKGD